MNFFKKIFSSEKKESNLNEQDKQNLDKGLEKSKSSFFSKLTIEKYFASACDPLFKS